MLSLDRTFYNEQREYAEMANPWLKLTAYRDARVSLASDVNLAKPFDILSMKSNPNQFVFRSPHSIEECHRRLKESVDTSFFPYFSSKQVAGRVSKYSILLRKRISYRNSFQTVLRASLRASSRGTEIISTIGLHPFVKIFMFIWFGGLIFIGGIIFVLALSSFFNKNSPTDIGSIMGILIPPVMAVFGTALLKFGKYLARDESKLLRKFLIDLLDANEINNVEQAAAQGPLVPRGL